MSWRASPLPWRVDDVLDDVVFRQQLFYFSIFKLFQSCMFRPVQRPGKLHFCHFPPSIILEVASSSIRTSKQEANTSGMQRAESCAIAGISASGTPRW